MSDSYFETIGRQSGMTPQVDDKMAYADTEGSQVKNVGEQAKELEKDHSEFIQQRINDFNAQHTRNMATVGKLIDFIPTAMKGIGKLQDIQDDNDYWQRLKATGQSIADDGGLEEEDGVLNVGLYGEAGSLAVE